MTTPFDKFNSNKSSVSGSSFGNLYEGYRQTYSNIDAQYSALGNTGIFSYANSNQESTASKAMKWTNFSMGLLGGLASAGTSIASVVMMTKAMKGATQGARTASGASQSAAVAEYVKLDDAALQAKKTELTGKIVEYTTKEADAKQDKVDATADAKQAKTDYDTANTAYQDARKEKANQDRIASQAGSNAQQAQTRKGALEAKTAYNANATPEQQANMRTQAEEAEYQKLKGAATVEGSVAYYEKQKADAEAESRRQEGIMNEQKAERDKQAKLQIENEEKATAAQSDETKYKGLKEKAQTDLNNVNTAITQKAAQPPEQTEPTGKKKKGKK